MQRWNLGHLGVNVPNHVWERIRSKALKDEQENVLVNKMVEQPVMN